MIVRPGAVAKRNLILLVPSFHEKPRRNQTLEILVRHFAAFLGCTQATDVNVAGYAGKQVAVAGTRQTQYHFFELYWQDLSTLLSDEKVFVQIGRGIWTTLTWASRMVAEFVCMLYLFALLVLVTSWLFRLYDLTLARYDKIAVGPAINLFGSAVAEAILTSPKSWIFWLIVGAVLAIFSIVRLTRTKHRGWNFYLFLGLVAMAFWLYGILAVALNSVGGADKSLVGELQAVSKAMLGWPVWVYASLLFGVLAINVGAIADVTDLITRYFTEAIEKNGLTQREQYGTMICQSVGSILGQQSYDQVTIVGHSFGAAIIVDAIASQRHDWLPTCTLITLGGFMEFLNAQFPQFDGRVKKCMAEPKLLVWKDFFAIDDLFTSSKAYASDTAIYKPQLTNNGAGFIDKITGRSHGYYFKNPEVLQALT